MTDQDSIVVDNVANILQRAHCSFLYIAAFQRILLEHLIKVLQKSSMESLLDFPVFIDLFADALNIF